jgi:hypothetical protein
MSQHLRRWGALYILAALFLGSWIGQLVAQLGTIAEQGWSEFWAATFENWQSEFLQLGLQALLISAYSHVLFRKGDEDRARLEAKVDTLLRLWREGGEA